MKTAGSPEAPLTDFALMVEAACGEAGILWGERNDRHPIDLRPHAELRGDLATQTSVAYVRPEKLAEDRALFALFDVVVPPPDDDAAHV